MLLNSFINCIERNKFIDAIYFEKQLHNCFFSEVEIYERLVFTFAKNLMNFYMNDDKLSILEMRKCIATMRLVNCHHLADTFEQYLRKNSVSSSW